MSDRLRVCLVLEGSYPYITGGVGAWMHDIIRGLPHIDFFLLTLSPRAGQELRYELPANVVGHRDVVLGSSEPSSSQRPARGLVKAVVDFHRRVAAGRESSISALLAAASSPDGFSTRLLEDGEAWSILPFMNERRNPAYPFSDYLWAWHASHRLLFEALRVVAPEADVYHAISTGFAGLVALCAKARTGRPFALTEHGLYHKEREMEIRKADFVHGYQRDLWIRLYNSLSERCYREADAVVALFEENRRIQVGLGAPAERCAVIPNGIDVARFSSVRRSPRPGRHVGLVGRVVPIKDVKTFIMAARLVVDAVPDCNCYVIGPTDEDPEYYAECVRLADSLGLGERLAFTGRANVLDYYAFLDVLLLTSVREAQPLVLIEAWAAGVPTVTTAVGNVPEMLGGDDRYLARPKDAEGLAARAVWLLRHPEEAASDAEARRAAALERYRKDDMLRSYGELYEGVGRGSWRA